jgi:hypothetical protein
MQVRHGSEHERDGEHRRHGARAAHVQRESAECRAEQAARLHGGRAQAGQLDTAVRRDGEAQGAPAEPADAVQQHERHDESGRDRER